MSTAAVQIPGFSEELAKKLPGRKQGSMSDVDQLGERLQSSTAKAISVMKNSFLIIGNHWNAFIHSEEYKAYTAVPTGNKLAKKVRHKFHKESFQEFTATHLKDQVLRAKYGPKLVAALLKGGFIRKDQEREYLAATKEVPDTTEHSDILEVKLIEYFVRPVILNRDGLVQSETPLSGFPIFESFLAREGREDSAIVDCLKGLYTIKYLLENEGNIAALKYFQTPFYSSCATREIVRFYCKNAIPATLKNSLFHVLQINLVEPFRQLHGDLKTANLDFHSLEQAKEHSVNLERGNPSHRRMQKPVKEIYWV